MVAEGPVTLGPADPGRRRARLERRSNVLHDWGDADATSILRTVHRAMRPQAHLLIVENVLDAPGRTAKQQRDVHLVDLHMLVMFGARERTKAEYDAVLVDAGFAPSRLSRSPSTWNVLQAVGR